MARISDRYNFLMIGASAFVLGYALPAEAQAPDSGAVAAAAMRQSGSESDIIVTAQKRSERLQDVPIAVVALTGQSLETKGVTNSLQLGQVTPGLTTTTLLTFSQPFIRGIGSQSTALSDEPSVSTYVDGVYIAQTLGQVFDFNDVDRIEVLKGPQGTLFGRNATGGAILITTLAPSFEPTGKFDASYGNYNAVNLRGYVSAGLTDTVAASVTAGYGRRDSLFHDINLGRRGRNWDRYSVRGKLLIQPSDPLKITLSADYTHDNNAEALFVRSPDGQSFGVPSTGPFTTKRYQSSLTELPTQPLEQFGASARIEYETAAFDIVSINGYRHTHVTPVFDIDGGPLFVANLISGQAEKNYSNELQLVSNGSGPLKWMIGGYHYYNRAEYTNLVVITPAGRTVIGGTLTTNSYAGFADGTYEFGRLSLTAGIRYSWERRRYFDGTVNGFAVPVVGEEGVRKSFRSFTPRAILSYKPNSDVLLYASFSKGFKSGLYNAASFAQTPVSPEKTTAYEIGAKTTPLRDVTFNLSAFWYESKDLQVQASATVSSLTELLNAASARSRGIDADMSWRVAPGFNIRAGVSYLDARYRRFPDAAVYMPSAPGGGNTLLISDVSGNRLVRAPKWTINFGADYQYQFANGGSLQPSFNIYYSSKFAWEPLGRIQNPSYVNINSQLTYNFPGDNIFVRGWVRNLTNAAYYSSEVSNSFGDNITYAEPRTYGGTVGIKF